jgi:hypothetical protein
MRERAMVLKPGVFVPPGLETVAVYCVDAFRRPRSAVVVTGNLRDKIDNPAPELGVLDPHE